MKRTWTRSHQVFILIVMFLVTSAGAVTYPVGPGKPYADLQSVAPLLLPGDRVEVDGNHTYPGDIVFTQPGSAAHPITIHGIRINGNRPVIAGGTNTVHFQTDWPYSGPGADHYVFEGFEITGGTFRGVFHQAGDLTLRDCCVHDCPQHGILGADDGSGSMTMEYVEVFHCGSGDSRHPIYMATDEVNRPGSVFRMQYCYVHDGMGGNNVKSRAERNEIYFNWIEGAYYHELELIGPEDAPTALVREDSDVVGNVLVKRNTSSYVTRVGGDGTGETYGRYRFVNNTFICGANSAFRLFDGIESIEMHNNVFYRSSGGIDIIRTVDATWSTGSELIAGQNNWVLSGTSDVPVQWTGTLFGTDPGFMNFTTDDLRPGTGSALTDAGAETLSGPPGYPFPNPLFPPAFHPPFHAAGLPGSEEPRPDDAQIDIGAYEFRITVCVDDSNQTGTETGTVMYPYSTIQAAVNAALDGSFICVAAGLYSENITVSDKPLHLVGGYSGGTPAAYAAGLGGDFNARDPAVNVSSILAVDSDDPAVVFIWSGASGSSITGFTISGGDTGVYFDDDDTWPLLVGITVSENSIENNGPVNDPAHWGGGVYATGSHHVIQGNVIQNNHSGRGAGLVVNGDNLTISDNHILNNTGYGDHGGGIFQVGTATISGNLIQGNATGVALGYGWGGGVLILGTATMAGNTILSNTAPSDGGGVFIDEEANAMLEHEVIAFNTTTEADSGGAGIYVDGGDMIFSTAVITNCTVAYNTGSGWAGGNGILVEGNSVVTARNCIFWGNGDDFTVQSGSSLTVVYSCSAEVIAGSGNMHTNPLFFNSPGGDFHVVSTTGRWDPGAGMWAIDSQTSPAVDAGDPVSAYNLEPVPNGGRINMGA
ncbi:right-handed parallel beta-helix repeat-containing protein, partial [bacterium]|nr:right-handed parallel beta-helix repeat-containing protein [candidate division CSSED10-310 bacterium]